MTIPSVVSLASVIDPTSPGVAGNKVAEPALLLSQLAAVQYLVVADQRDLAQHFVRRATKTRFSSLGALLADGFHAIEGPPRSCVFTRQLEPSTPTPKCARPILLAFVPPARLHFYPSATFLPLGDPFDRVDQIENIQGEVVPDKRENGQFRSDEKKHAHPRRYPCGN